MVLDGMIADMESNKKLSPRVAQLFLRGKKLNISLVFTLFYHKIPNKKELQQIASNHSSNIDFKDFMKLYNDYTKEPYSFLVNATTLLSDNPFRFRMNLL